MTHPLYPSLTPEMLAAGRERYVREYDNDHWRAWPTHGPSSRFGHERLDRWLAHRHLHHEATPPPLIVFAKEMPMKEHIELLRRLVQRKCDIAVARLSDPTPDLATAQRVLVQAAHDIERSSEALKMLEDVAIAARSTLDD